MHGFAYYLRKHFVVGVFCFANQFAEKERLFGLFTGMVISEKTEADTLNVSTTQEELDREFARAEAKRKKLIREEVERELRAQFHIPVKIIRISQDEND